MSKPKILKVVVTGNFILLILVFMISCSTSQSKLSFKKKSDQTGIYELDSTGAEFKVLDNDSMTHKLKSKVSIGMKNFESLEISEYCSSNEMCINFQFDNEGIEMYSELTKENKNQQIFFVIDGVVIAAPFVMAKITTGGGQYPIKKQFFDSLFVTN